MKRTTMILAFAVAFIISARGQVFQNLNFESAYNLPGNPGNGVLISVTNALPDWTAYYDDVALSQVYYGSNSLGIGGAVELEGGSLALGGNNLSVFLNQGGSIGQTGLVPTNAESLQFEADGPINLEVTLGGQSLSFSTLSEGPDYDVYGANIPADLDGQMEALNFSMQGGPGETLLDDIDFSVVGVPEPSEYALLGLGVILLGLRLKQQRMQQFRYR